MRRLFPTPNNNVIAPKILDFPPSEICNINVRRVVSRLKSKEARRAQCDSTCRNTYNNHHQPVLFSFSYRDRAWFGFYEMYPSPFVKRVAVSNCLAIFTFWHATKLPFEKRRIARPLSSFIVRPAHGRGDGLGSDKIGTQMNILACGMGLK